MRVVFAGTPEPAVVALEKLIASDHEVVAVLTRPDAKKGRGRTLHPSPVKALAQEHGIEVFTPEKLKGNEEIKETLEQLAPDAIPVVAYGNLIPEDFLGIPVHGWINLHFSLLPRWRGAAPVQAGILHGDEYSGATTFRIDAGLDTGDILLQEPELIRPDDTADDLLTRLAYSGGDLLVRTMNDLATGHATFTPQEGEATYAPKISKDDARIDWTASAQQIDRAIRAYTPGPGAWTTLNGDRVKVGPVSPVGPESPVSPASGDAEAPTLEPGQLGVAKNSVRVGTGTTAVELDAIQPPGKKMMSAADWARGLQDTEGVTFE